MTTPSTGSTGSTPIDTHVSVRLVDEQWRDSGVADKIAAHSDGGQRHRAFSSFLFTSDSRLLLQQRAASKYHWPLVWSNTCCGHPASVHTAVDDARTRIREELGIDAPPLTEAAVVEYRFTDPATGLTEWEVNHIVFGISDAAPQPDPDEVGDIEFVDAERLDEIVRTRSTSAWLGSVLGPLLTSDEFISAAIGSAWSSWTDRARTAPHTFLTHPDERETT